MNKWLSRVAITLAGCMLGSLAGVPDAQAGMTAYVTFAPGPLLLNTVGASGTSGCIVTNVFGGIELGTTSNCQWGAWENGAQTGWSPWRGGDINIPWASNPGADTTASWNVTLPNGDTQFRARLASMDESGSIAHITGWVNGGGGNWTGVQVAGFGPLILNFQMRAYRATSTGTRYTPVLHVIAGNVYSN